MADTVAVLLIGFCVGVVTAVGCIRYGMSLMDRIRESVQYGGTIDNNAHPVDQDWAEDEVET